MAGTKVGDLYAELGLDDKLNPELKKAKTKADATVKDMDTEVKLGLDTSPMEKELRKSEGKMKDTGSDMGGLLMAGMAGAAAVGGALVVGEFFKAVDRDAAQASAGIKMGLTPEMAKAAGEMAGDIYVQGFGSSLGEVSDVVGAVGKNMGGFGDKSKEEVDELAKGVLTLVDVFGVDLNEVTAAAGTMMKTGLAKDGMEALSIITRGLQSPANKADDMLETFTEYSTQFRKLGIDGPTALGLMSQGLQGGARDADIVADMFKEFSIRAIDGTDLTRDAFTSLGLDATAAANTIAAGGPIAALGLQNVLDKLMEIEDPVERNRIGVALFGTQWEDMGASVNGLDLTTAKDQVGGIETAMADATAATDTNASRIESWKRGAQENISDWIANSGIPAIEGFTADLEDMGEQWETGRGLVGEFHGGLMILGDGFLWLKNEVVDPFVGSLQTLFGWLGDTIEKVENLGSAITGGPTGENSALAGGSAGAAMFGLPGLALGSLLGSFDTGGVVPGRRGAPGLALVHGGETILPTHKSNADRWVKYEDGSTGLQRTDENGNWYGVRPVDDPATYAMKRGMDAAAAITAASKGKAAGGSGLERPLVVQVMIDKREIGRAVIGSDRPRR